MSKQLTANGLKPLWKWAISLCVLAHLGCIALTMATNRARSTVQDQVHGFLQPYLMGLNWYQETLPIDWVVGPDTLESTVAFQTMESDDWQVLMPLQSTTIQTLGFDREKSTRLTQLLTEIARSENEEGTLRILKSIVLHAESQRTERRIQRIRVVRKKFRDSEIAFESKSSSEEVLFEASIARFEDGSVGFIPKIEDLREVRSENNPRQQP